MKTISLVAPSAWASAIVNGDYSGLEPNEVRALNTFLALEGLAFVSPIACNDAGFRRRHDAWAQAPLATDCQTYVFPAPTR